MNIDYIDNNNENINNTNFLEQQNYFNKNNIFVKYKFLKTWIISIIIITVIYFLYWITMYDTHPISYFSKERYNYLKFNTPAYPPPLSVFMNPDVENIKYVTSDDYIPASKLL